YKDALRTCLVEVCGIEPPPPPPEPTCEQLCAMSARKVLETCLANGGSAEECRAQYEQALRTCLLENCAVEPPPPPPDPTCEELCYRSAKEAFAACIESGGTEEACRLEYQEALRACLLDNCNVEPPPPPEPPLPCDEACSDRAAQFYDACLLNGGTPETCRTQADALLSLCLVRCGSLSSCENRCAVAAQIVLTGCALGGLPTEECRRLANVVLETCIQGCVPPDACDSECERLAALARDECIARGGSREECALASQDVLATCLRYCEGVPMPGCDVQCEDMAAALAARCAAAGLPVEYCETLKDRFLDACIAYHSENCSTEELAGMSMFMPFRRGDVNGDGAIDIADPIGLLQQLFAGRPMNRCEDALDANDDGAVNVADPICILAYLFGQNSLGLPAPFASAGQDPTSDALICQP
ncbi:MAG TPA: hypothetical protein DCM87_21250, partial [Planctomycetes bacterium]|nr:hypothetical protein [Planctomycetota bacterium]